MMMHTGFQSLNLSLALVERIYETERISYVMAKLKWVVIFSFGQGWWDFFGGGLGEGLGFYYGDVFCFSVIMYYLSGYYILLC